jgi:STE24 endopeptidase
MAITTALAVGAAEIVVACARGAGVWWWLVAAGVFAAAGILLTNLAPLVIFPLFYRFTPLAREGLRDRLLALSAKAGVRVLGAFEWELGSRTRRANAALVGLGATRRILLADTLLEAYSDDEIEVVLAHELAHHVHHDIRTGLAFESLVVVAGLGAADVTVRLLAPRTGVTGPDEPAALPLVALAAAVISVLLLPLANALSRRNERRADRFALALTKHPAAFISAIRRLGAQNLAEEHPSRLTYHLFHTHPTVEERVRAAATTQPESGIADQQSLITNP